MSYTPAPVYKTNNFSKKPERKKGEPEKAWKTFDVDLEVVEFYPHKVQKDPKKLKGTMHVYLIHYGIDIKGINVIIDKEKDKFHFFIPSYKGWDADEQKFIKYPAINFLDNEKQRKLVSNIIKAGKNYMKKLLNIK